jgi:CheY-like chemotaxis protein
MAALTVNEAMVPGSGSSGALAGVRVLLVEDEDATRAALAKLLRVSGAKVTAAATAAEACAAFERAGARRPDVLLSDISMPDMDGYTLLGQIRSLEARNKLLEDPVPAIAITARARAGDAERAVQAGFAVHLAKPVEPQKLISVLLDVTARSS